MVTLKEVAQKAKVSVSTASKVLSQSKTAIPISRETKEKVITAAKELKYHPNLFARSLRTGKTYTVGFIVADIEDPFFAPIISGVEHSLGSAGYHFLLSNAKDTSGEESFYLEYYRRKRVDGILLAGVTKAPVSDSILKAYQKETSIVLISRKTGNDNIPSVIVDNVEGGYKATKHLLKLGHRKILFLSGPPEKPDCQARLEGYKKALKEAGLPFRKEMLKIANHTPDKGYNVMKDILNQRKDITAAFAYNDYIAFGAIRAIKEMGMNIPKDFSIVGFDDILMASYVDPPLTTIRQPLKDMGKKAAELLLQRILSSKKSVFNDVVLNPDLIIRNSTGNAK
ncbi:MAG: LacI family DNA-binding transcriptional regulator [Candidatus Omnitrophica bacterium]|nr:LacI family DNA-binding transcriptional regulator [Candidatus Omnitrophota bacterium]